MLSPRAWCSRGEVLPVLYSHISLDQGITPAVWLWARHPTSLSQQLVKQAQYLLLLLCEWAEMTGPGDEAADSLLWCPPSVPSMPREKEVGGGAVTYAGHAWPLLWSPGTLRRPKMNITRQQEEILVCSFCCIN